MDRPVKANIFMLCFLIYSGCLITGAIIFMSYLGIIDPTSAEFISFITLFQDIFMFLMPIVLCCLVTHTKIGDIIPHDPLSLKNIAMIVVISFFTMPVMNWLGSLSLLFTENTMQEYVIDMMRSHSLPYMLTALAIMPAVFEELTFRGLIMSGYKRTGIICSILVSALFFGIMHLSLYQLIYAAAAGIVFGILVQFTNSIFSSMLAHFIINGTQVFVSKLALDFVPEEILESSEEMSNMQMIAESTQGLLFALPILILLLYVFIRMNKGREVDYTYSLSPQKAFTANLDIPADKLKVVDLAFILIIIFYVLYMILLGKMS